MLLQPAGSLASGTITLPLNTGVPDGTTVLITTTQEIASLTIALNGASAIFGGVTSLAAGTATALRFYQPTNSWYQLNSETVYGSGVQNWLSIPSSDNLRAAVTDETGTGSLVFATSPNLVTPVLGTPTSGTLTNCTGLPVTTGISGLAANVAAFLATPSSANLAAALTDETGTGANVFANTPTLVTPNIGAATGISLAVSGAVSGASVASTGAVTSSGASGVGYATGAGGTVTQGTSRTTGVTINKTCGSITLFSAAGSATPATFTVTNSTVAAGDVIILNQKSGTDLYDLKVTAVAAGSFNITFNTTGGTTTEQPVFNFAVIKAVAA